MKINNLNMKEIRIETFRSGGKGGQNVNKVETGVRAVHIPSGITATSTKYRSQYQNKVAALQSLSAKLKKKNEKPKERIMIIPPTLKEVNKVKRRREKETLGRKKEARREDQSYS